ncbi:MAG: polyphosphate polymerase domain-containing protein [Clostridiales bacterium]|nr:polyphosphate polymerase domain-containing protein [Clostridiales bacterium]
MEPLYRVEDKYLCNEQTIALIQARLKSVLNPDKNQTMDNGYKITSVYFDDYYDTHLHETVDGYHLRQKYRIRIYNDSFQTIKLEIKYKKENRVYKKTQTITQEQMNMLLAGECVPDANPSLDSTITLFNLAIANQRLQPKVIVEYDRAAYIFDAGNVRITLDRNLRFSTDFDGFIHNNQARYLPVPDIDRIVEIKYDEFLPKFIAGLLETGNMNQTSYSKYRICRDALY